MKNNVNSMEIIEKFITSWRITDKHPCPKCGVKLGMPDYKCEKCNVKLKLIYYTEGYISNK